MVDYKRKLPSLIIEQPEEEEKKDQKNRSGNPQAGHEQPEIKATTEMVL